MPPSNEQLSARLQAVENNMATKEDIRELKESVSGLVEAWNTASGLVKFVKWVAYLAGAILGAWAAAKQIWPGR